MYDELSRVTKRTIRNLSSNVVLSEESYSYDAAGNITGSCGNTAFTYVYGLGLIGEEKQGSFKTYHFDYRGSTVAITDASGNITDTFKYDTYGKLLSRTGTSFVIFGYNGRDGVITDKNDLIYMRARYYAPELRRFVNADIIPGQISNAVTLNRYAYANSNPVMYIDPTGYLGVITLMLIGAGIGALCGAIGSVVSEKVESELNNEEFELDLGELAVDTLWGAFDGAISFSPIGPKWKAFAEAFSTVGSAFTDELMDDEDGIDFISVVESIACDYIFGKFDIDLTNNGNISKALRTTNDTIADLNRRANRDWVEKQIRRQKDNFNDLLQLKIIEDVFNNFSGMCIDAGWETITHEAEKKKAKRNYLKKSNVTPRK